MRAFAVKSSSVARGFAIRRIVPHPFTNESETIHLYRLDEEVNEDVRTIPVLSRVLGDRCAPRAA
ncbi:hypothetical protein EJ571_13425 [Mycobacteroides franklinii]|uniref:Uncharacterized protein n=1 Tax=Mycobacteroides franklinii TaxID=948102 RepID=A0A4R5PA72_9MYCO|nr:hypothetical protein EJ571_13425 [Mycobacteroides franklinii]